jgi:UDP-2-acetamido-2,6-beta-L-arabino-hexul-4-ose reductase
MRILITGARGFIASNLRVRLGEAGFHDLVCITRDSSLSDLRAGLAGADFVFHLAGINRPKTEDEFTSGNRDFTQLVCKELAATGRRTPLLFASSIQAIQQNPYGQSKLAAESTILQYGQHTQAPHFVFRLANVFGKWARPNYNSAVATFCHNITRGLPITINDPSARLQLIHIDDVVDAFMACLNASSPGSGYVEADPVYETTVGDVADMLRGFAESRSSLLCPAAGVGLVRALYSTYVSYLPVTAFSYKVPQHRDSRGIFTEVLKTPEYGQFSYFTAGPGITRGEHYHHSKTEKFVVIQGTALFRFRHIESGQFEELLVPGGAGTIVETIPGWAHDITNVGSEELIVMLWANEVFDRSRPDTVAMKIVP